MWAELDYSSIPSGMFYIEPGGGVERLEFDTSEGKNWIGYEYGEDENEYWGQFFGIGYQGGTSKSYSGRFRAVRGF